MAAVVKLQPVTEQDCRLLWEWANDPTVRAAAFSRAPIPWDTHVAWFRNKQTDPRCLMYVAMDRDGRPVGQARFDQQDDGWAEVDVSIAPAVRGGGYGTEVIRLACDRVLATSHLRGIRALVKTTNVASLMAFERAGFTRAGVEQAHGVEVVRLLLHRPTAPPPERAT